MQADAKTRPLVHHCTSTRLYGRPQRHIKPTSGDTLPRTIPERVCGGTSCHSNRGTGFLDRWVEVGRGRWSADAGPARGAPGGATGLRWCREVTGSGGTHVDVDADAVGGGAALCVVEVDDVVDVDLGLEAESGRKNAISARHRPILSADRRRQTPCAYVCPLSHIQPK